MQGKVTDTRIGGVQPSYQIEVHGIGGARQSPEDQVTQGCAIVSVAVRRLGCILGGIESETI